MKGKRSARRDPEIVLERGPGYRILLIPQVRGSLPPALTPSRRRTLRRIQRDDEAWAKQFRTAMGP